MLGVVLCGGQSSRMGADKGLLKLEAKTWAQTAIDKLSSLSIPVKISVNIDQFESYAEVFPSTDLINDNAALSLRGPLRGTLSCHLAYPHEDLFLLACDMPLMDPFLLNKLNVAYQQPPRVDAYVFTNDGEPEPLCGIYTAQGLSNILNMFHQDQLTKHSMKFMLDHLTVSTITITDDQKKYFRNFNAHAELNGL